MTGDRNVIELIKRRQQAWAHRQQHSLDTDGYCACADDNLFRGLSEAARKDFTLGGGGELRLGGERGKLWATHSSSALACNWFDYWRDRDLSILSAAFGVHDPFVTLRLEAHVPTGMRGADANVDVLFTTANGSLFAVESKFTEVYAQSTEAKTILKPQYFAQNRARWVEVGLVGCQGVAEQLRSGEHNFTVLDVAQLLKHMLALARTGNRWTLCCLWYEVPGPVADAHRADLKRFGALIGTDASHFAALTYQELFRRMAPVVGAADAEYMAYVRDRYIDAAQS